MTKYEELLMLMDCNADACSEWTGALTTKGYGQLHYRGKVVAAHRLSYLLHNGTECEQVRHTCDNRKCVNPHHLVAGDQQSNMQDMVDRGNSCRGEKHWACKLTQEQVCEIVRSTDTQASLANEYGVSPATVGDIKAGRKWKWLTKL